MPTISEQNNLQIRQPMSVSIELSPEAAGRFAFTLDDTVKVMDHPANRILIAMSTQGWPMRKLADLQDTGFPLDGSHVLYSTGSGSSVVPSAANGKVGLRGNLNEQLHVHIENDGATIESFTSVSTEASTVECNGTTYQIPSSGYITLEPNAAAVDLYYTPKTPDRRITVSLIAPGARFHIGNDELISCIVSLRSDLKPVGPTLPESEIEIQFYYDEDISASLAAIPDDTPLTYQSGYDDDLSPVRTFYTSDQVTWSDNVITIRAVDAIHKLDGQMVYPVLLGSAGPDGRSQTSVNHLPLLMQHEIERAGIYPEIGEDFAWKSGAPLKDATCVVTEQSTRDFIAFVNNFHALGSYFVEGVPHFWPTFVDAGRPKLTYLKPEAQWDIYEEDCGDVKRHVEKKTDAYRYNKTTATLSNLTGTEYVPVGSGTWVKNSGIFIDPDDFVFFATAQYNWDGGFVINIPGWVTGDSSIVAFQNAAVPEPGGMRIGLYLMGPNIPKGVMSDSTYDWNSQVLPWGQNDLLWLQYVEAHQPGADQADIVLQGAKVVTDTVEGETYGDTTGNITDIDLGNLVGEYRVGKYDEAAPYYRLFPDTMLLNLLRRSNETGSFIWKGDPRMQPRDVANFHRLDGSVEEITVESITLKHEGGGTTAEIVYRKGVV